MSKNKNNPESLVLPDPQTWPQRAAAWALAKPSRVAGIGLGLLSIGVIVGVGATQGWVPLPHLPNASAQEPAPPQLAKPAAAAADPGQVTLDEMHMQNVKVEPVALVQFRELKPAIGQV